MDAPQAVTALFAENLTTNTGTPEWWLNQHFPAATDFAVAALADADGEGVPNWSEYIADTDPNNAASYFHAVAVSNLSGRVAVSFQSSSGRNYGLEACTNLATRIWVGVDGQPHVPGTGGVQALIDTNRTGTARFYRLRVGFP